MISMRKSSTTVSRGNVFRSELGEVFTCLNPTRKIQEHSVMTKTVTLDESTTKNVL